MIVQKDSYVLKGMLALRLTGLMSLLICMLLSPKAQADSTDTSSKKRRINFYIGNTGKFPKDTSAQDTSVKSLVGLRASGLQNHSTEHYFGSFGTQAGKDYKGGKFLEDMQVSGVFRFVTIYRNMQKSYDDMLTSDRNISFMDYPVTDIGSSGGVGNPMLALALTSNVNKSASFRVSYSIGHLFAGSPNHDVSKFFKSFGGIALEGNIKTDPVFINLRYGGLLTLRVSRLVFDAPKYRNNFFDRLVSNNLSVGKVENMYSKEEEARSFLYPYVKGGIARFTFRDLNNLQVLAMYGRTGHTIITTNTLDEFPAVNYLFRVRSPYRYRSITGGIALNYYMKDADTDPIQGIRDDVQLFSSDFDVKFGKITFTGEVGMSEIRNPLVQDPKWGKAFIFGMDISKDLFKLPLSIEYYNIDHDFGNLDSEVLNSNVALKDGGATTTGETDQTLFVNVAQEAGLVANNRSGISLSTNNQIGDLSIQFAYGVSVEKENIYDSVTFQHRVNAFSRSRFWQWRQGIGPYSRIRSIYARTFELVGVRDNALGNSTDYKKGFNNAELLLTYNFNLLGKRIIVTNFNNFVSIQDQLSVLPQFTDKAFIRTFYEDVTLICKLTQKFMIIGNYGYERVWGNTRMELSPDKPTDPEKDRVINQTGTAFGFGFGFDISAGTSFHFRHKWMDHKDKNFLNDQFKGQESTIELKIFL